MPRKPSQETLDIINDIQKGSLRQIDIAEKYNKSKQYINKLKNKYGKPKSKPDKTDSKPIKQENKEFKPKSKPKKTNLNYRALLTAVNNYLIAYRKAYESAKENPLSEVKLKYEEMLKQKTMLEKKIN